MSSVAPTEVPIRSTTTSSIRPPHLLQPSPSSYKDPLSFVQEQFLPKVAIFATADADECCQQLGLDSFEDLVHPFGGVPKVQTRDSQGLTTVFETYKVRFCDIRKLEDSNVKASQAVFADIAKRNVNPQFKLENSPDLLDNLRQSNLEQLTPWFSEFRRWHLKFFSASEHETFDHPVCVVYVVTSRNPDPVNALYAMNNQASPAPAFEKGWLDPNVLKYYILLHDCQHGNDPEIEILLTKMKRTFGLNSHLLRINTTGTLQSSEQPVGSRAPLIPDYWASVKSETAYIQSLANATTSSVAQTSQTSVNDDVLPKESMTTEITSTGPTRTMETSSSICPAIFTLSPNDIQNIENFVRELVVHGIVPYMERNIHHWNEQIASSRRGITGKLFQASKKYFGGGSTRSGGTSASYSFDSSSTGKTGYPHNSPEATLRKLADYAFMLRDYKFASGIYDTVRKDFSNDKAWKYLAGAQEMIGLCQLLLEQSPGFSAVETAFEQSISNYNRSGLSLYAIRSALLYYELLKRRNMFREASSILIRMTGEDDDLRSALLLEQAAICFAKGRGVVTMYRKCAFHLILAGHRYAKCGQRHHANRCYLFASQIYRGKNWSLIDDHINFTLGRQSFHLLELEKAVQYFQKLLRESHQSPTQQAAYLREFLYIYKNAADSLFAGAGFPIQLTIPDIPDSKTRLLLSNSASHETKSVLELQPSLLTSDEESWSQLERDMEEAMFSSPADKKGNTTKYGTLKGIHELGERVVGAVGEPAFFEFELFNPMNVPLQLNSIKPVCEYKESTSAKLASASENFVEIETIQELMLQERERRTVQIKLIPKREGAISVKGISYVLNQTVSTVKSLNKRGRRLNETKDQRSSAKYAPDHTLTLIVTAPMPLLDISFHSLPNSLVSGEVVRCILEINNKGEKGLKNLKVKLSHPSFVIFGTPEQVDKSSYSSSLATTSMLTSESFTALNRMRDSSVADIPLPSNQPSGELMNSSASRFLPSGETTIIPVWIRGDKVGKHALKFLFAYQAQGGQDSIRNCRVLRYGLNMTVQPSLRVNCFIRNSLKSLNEVDLGVEIENLQSDVDYQILQLSSLSPAWLLVPLTEFPISEENRIREQSSLHVAARQTLFKYYRLKRNPKFVAEYQPEKLSADALSRLVSGEEIINRPTDISLTSSTIAIAPPISTHADPLLTFTLRSHQSWKINQISSRFPTVTPRQTQVCFPLFQTHEVDLVLFWEANRNNQSHRGHHYVIGINLSPQQNPLPSQYINKMQSKALFEATNREKLALLNSLTRNKHIKDESPLKVSMIFKQRIQWLGESRLCLLKGDVLLMNCAWQSDIKFEMVLGQKGQKSHIDESHKSDYSNPPAMFYYLGNTRQEGRLKPDQILKIPVEVCFLQPGVFDVNAWSIVVTLTGNKGDIEKEEHGLTFIQSPKVPFYVTVEESTQ